MKYGIAFLARFGLFAPKVEKVDQFDLRLERIGRREKRHDVRLVLFKSLHEPQAA